MFDLQVNGYVGVDFNSDELSGEDLNRACRQIRADGVEHILATIITDDLASMRHRLRRLVALREADSLANEVIAGIHIEGPFISPLRGYVGAHPVDAVQTASLDEMEQLLEAAGGLTRIVTLAPEQDPQAQVTKRLAQQGIVVAAGHSNATLDELWRGIDAGLAMFTHLGNGCPAELPRHDNIIQRVLSLGDQLWISFIADGVHVPYFALKNYLTRVGAERAIIVSDATAAAGLGPGSYSLGRQTVEVGEDLVAWGPDRSHLVGSAMPLNIAARELESASGLSTEEIERLTNLNPHMLIPLN